VIDRAHTIRYLESSAIVALLVDAEAAHEAIRALAEQPQRMVTSVITVVECRRALVRAHAQGRIGRVTMDAAQHQFTRLLEQCDLFEVDEIIVDLASESLGDNHLHTLDALHVATAMIARNAFGYLSFVSLDARVRSAAIANGLSVLPAALPPLIPAP
jgi:predicted nucleic acid-binding protein